MGRENVVPSHEWEKVPEPLQINRMAGISHIRTNLHPTILTVLLSKNSHYKIDDFGREPV